MFEYVGFEFDMLRAAMQALAAPAPVQLAHYTDLVVKADELALDFDDALLLVRQSRAPEIDSRLAAALAALDELLARMIGPTRPDLWAENALRSRPEWAKVRSLASAALAAFGWPVEPPPPNPHVYVRGSS
ncbi:MAG TPA: hypothetical protein VGE02_12555 [Gemmatimonadales bacterium]